MGRTGHAVLVFHKEPVEPGCHSLPAAAECRKEIAVEEPHRALAVAVRHIAVVRHTGSAAARHKGLVAAAGNPALLVAAELVAGREDKAGKCCLAEAEKVLRGPIRQAFPDLFLLADRPCRPCRKPCPDRFVVDEKAQVQCRSPHTLPRPFHCNHDQIGKSEYIPATLVPDESAARIWSPEFAKLL